MSTGSVSSEEMSSLSTSSSLPQNDAPQSSSSSSSSLSSTTSVSSLSSSVSEQVLDISEQTRSDAESEVEEYTKELEHFLKNQLHSTKARKFRDKIFFLLGVGDALFLLWASFVIPWIMPYFYTIKFPILIGARAWVYGKRRWHLFLLDFCYFANLICLAAIWTAESPRLNAVAFSLSWGPLFWAVLLFRNSLVFHDYDKMTSLYIHVSPALTMWCVRFFPRETTFLGDTRIWWNNFRNFDGCNETSSFDDCKNFSFDSFELYLWQLIVPWGIFISHSILYFIVVDLLFGWKIKKDRRYLYSYRYLTGKGGPLHEPLKKIPGRIKVFIFGGLNWFYALLTFLLGIFWFRNFYAATSFGVLVVAVGIWNGGSFYIDVFSRNIYAKIAARQKEKQEKQEMEKSAEAKDE